MLNHDGTLVPLGSSVSYACLDGGRWEGDVSGDTISAECGDGNTWTVQADVPNCVKSKLDSDCHEILLVSRS